MLAYRIFLSFIINSKLISSLEDKDKKQVLIYGFNRQGRQFLSTLIDDHFLKIVGIIDIDKNLRNIL